MCDIKIRLSLVLIIALAVSACAVSGKPTSTPVPSDTPPPEPSVTSLVPEYLMTNVVNDILSDPTYIDQEVYVLGYYRGWDLLKEVNASPPVTRSDWVVKDRSGAIYVEAGKGIGEDFNLDPSDLGDTETMVAIEAIVRMSESGQIYLEPTSVSIVT
jgi:hypothetical protein